MKPATIDAVCFPTRIDSSELLLVLTRCLT